MKKQFALKIHPFFLFLFNILYCFTRCYMSTDYRSCFVYVKLVHVDRYCNQTSFLFAKMSNVYLVFFSLFLFVKFHLCDQTNAIKMATLSRKHFISICFALYFWKMHQTLKIVWDILFKRFSILTITLSVWYVFMKLLTLFLTQLISYVLIKNTTNKSFHWIWWSGFLIKPH